MAHARARIADPEETVVLEAGVGTGLDHHPPVDHAVVDHHRAEGVAVGADRVGALRGANDAAVEESAELAVQVDGGAVLAGGDDLAVIVDDAIGLAPDGDAAGAGGADPALVDDVVALPGRDDDGAGSIVADPGDVPDRIVDAGNLDRVAMHPGGVGIDADHGVAVDRVGRDGTSAPSISSGIQVSVPSAARWRTAACWPSTPSQSTTRLYSLPRPAPLIPSKWETMESGWS